MSILYYIFYYIYIKYIYIYIWIKYIYIYIYIIYIYLSSLLLYNTSLLDIEHSPYYITLASTHNH